MGKKPKKERFELPLSGVVLGIVARALQLSSSDRRGVLSGKTASRYFAGERVSDEARREVVKAIADAGVKSGLFSLPAIPGIEQTDAGLLANFLLWLTGEWDGLVGRIRSMGLVISAEKRAAAAPLVYLRLAVIEVSLRAGALLRLCGLDAPIEGAPEWARASGQSSLLRSLMKQCRVRPTRDELAPLLEVHLNSIDAWLDGKKRPTDQNIVVLAEELASRIDGSSAALLAERLRRHYALHDLGARLSTRIGWDETEDLGAHLVSYTRLVHRLLSPTGIVPVDPLQVFIAGTRSEGAPVLVAQLWEGEEKNRLWRTDLVAACKPWLPRLQSVARDLSDRHVRDAAAAIRAQRGTAHHGIDAEKMAEMMAPTLAQIDMSMPMRRADGKKFKYAFILPADNAQKAANRITQARQCFDYSDFEGGVEHARRAVVLDPQGAEAHYTLGCALNLAEHFDEALTECWLAAALRPKWESPILEIGIIFTKTGRFRETCDLYARYEAELPPLSPLPLFEWGLAHLELQEYRHAIEKFDRVFKMAPEHAPALDCCAHCYFLLGDSVHGQQLAKKAQQLGHTASYDAWRAGRYRNQVG